MLFRFFCLLVLFLLFATTAHAEPLRIKLETGEHAGTADQLSISYLQKLLEERSNGRLKTEHTGTQTETLGNLGLLELDRLTDSPYVQVLQVPFLFTDRSHLHATLNNEQITVELLKPQAGIVPLAYWDNAALHLIGKANAPAGNKNSSCRDLTAAQNELGPSKTLATEAAPDSLTISTHRYRIRVLAADQDFWDTVPKDLRIIINGAVKDATRYHRELIEQQDLVEKNLLKTLGARADRISPSQRSILRRCALQAVPLEMSALIDMIKNIDSSGP